jgi:hypothetical protein
MHAASGRLNPAEMISAKETKASGIRSQEMKRILLTVSIFSIGLFACNRTQPVGPAERAGRNIDNAADEVHDDAVRTGHNAKEIARDVKQRLDPNEEAYENRNK